MRNRKQPKKNFSNLFAIILIAIVIITAGFIAQEKQNRDAEDKLLRQIEETKDEFKTEIVFGKTKQELFKKREELESMIERNQKLSKNLEAELRYTILAIRCNANQSERALLGKKVIEGFCDNKDNLESFSELNKGL